MGGITETTVESVGQHLKQHVEGQEIEITDQWLGELVDLARVKKIYKLNSLPNKGRLSDTASERMEMETFVLGAMALKGS